MTPWLPMLARITIFPVPGFAGRGALDLYKEIWSVEPDNFQRQQPVPLGIAIATGVVDGLQLSCQTMPMRADMSITVHPDLEAEVPRTPFIEDFAKLDEHIAKIRNVARDGGFASKANRVAIYFKYGRPATDDSSAVEALRSVLPKGFDVEGSAFDFQLQINRPTTSAAHEIQINVLQKWACEKLQVITFAFPAGGGDPSGGMFTPIPTQQEQIAATVAFDINTVQSPTGFDGSAQGSLIDELTAVLSEQRPTFARSGGILGSGA